MRQVIVIPARMGGTRLPGKPLINIHGKPMIQRVWERCIIAKDKHDVYVATEDIVVQEFCVKNDIQSILTPRADTAIDRIKLFSDIIPADAYINVQGDEPLANPQDILSILSYNLVHPDRIVFGKTSCNESEFRDFSKAKVVCDKNGRLIYASRAGLPASTGNVFKSAERAIWLYAFSKGSLDTYFQHGPGMLETIEDTEIIRFLEIGIPVYCLDLVGDSWAVDEPKDIQIVTRLIGSSS